MDKAEYELRYLRAGVEVLQAYLLSKEIYWASGARAPAGHPPYQQLTLGGILLAFQKASARRLTAVQKSRLAAVKEDLDREASRWKSAWQKKATQEARARLKLWNDYMNAYRSQPAQQADRYAYEVSRRVMLALLDPQTSLISAAERELLAGLDKLLKARLVPGEFIWDAELTAAFSKARYWYLYGGLPAL